MNPSYDHMLAEAHKILASMERDTLSIDELSSKIQEAYGLIDSLKKSLHQTEAQVNTIINARQEN